MVASRKVTVTGRIEGLDHETFGGHERAERFFSHSKFLTDESAQSVIDEQLRFGGEVRIELKLDAQLANANAVRITGIGKLFEGTSEDTNDLEEQKSIDLIVPADQSVSHTIELHNTESFGGDWAIMRFTCTNSLN